MLHLLKRHPFPVEAHLERCLALTYAFPAELLTPLLPPGLVLDTYGEFGFVAIALVETRSLRPAFLPRQAGQDFFLCGYRVFTRLGRAASSLRGLYILRSDTDQRVMSYLGNVFTHYRYCHCLVERERTGCTMRWLIRTPDGIADLSVALDLSAEGARLPEASPFEDWRMARRFAGPLPYTFDYERETQSIISVKGTRGRWNPRPASVSVERTSFFDREPFRRVQPLLANAFYVEDVPYHWDRGRRLVRGETDGNGSYDEP